MKTNYEAPQIEVIEIEIEDAVLSASLQATTSSFKSATSIETSSVTSGGSAW